ncbi:MAG: aldolase/citrate lyase family protein, partial [Planctomycetia bacterium]
IAAVRKADEIFSVPGVDAIFVGQNDLMASMRGPDGANPSAAEFEAALQEILAACKRNNVAAGIHCFVVEDVQRRLAEGWRFIALGSDLSMMLDAAKRDLAVLGKQPKGNLANY